MRALTVGFSAVLMALMLTAPSGAHARTWNDIPVNTKVLEAMPKRPVDQEKRQLGDDLCNMMMVFHSVKNDPGEGLNMFLQVETGITPDDPDFKQKLTDFWNANSQHFVCRSSDIEYDEPEPILHRMVSSNAIDQFYYEYLNSVRPDNGTRISHDFNIIHEKTGQTVIDYIDHLMKTRDADDPDMQEVLLLLKNMLRSRGALTAEEVLSL